jgi:hypothetical protein
VVALALNVLLVCALLVSAGFESEGTFEAIRRRPRFYGTAAMCEDVFRTTAAADEKSGRCGDAHSVNCTARCLEFTGLRSVRVAVHAGGESSRYWAPTRIYILPLMYSILNG